MWYVKKIFNTKLLATVAQSSGVDTGSSSAITVITKLPWQQLSDTGAEFCWVAVLVSV